MRAQQARDNVEQLGKFDEEFGAADAPLADSFARKAADFQVCVMRACMCDW